MVVLNVTSLILNEAMTQQVGQEDFNKLDAIINDVPEQMAWH